MSEANCPLYLTLPWRGPFAFGVLFDLAGVLDAPGVYVFTEFETPLHPRRRSTTRSHPNYQVAMEEFRSTKAVLYMGKSKSLKTRLRSCRFSPGKAHPHKGQGLIHSQQFHSGPLYVWWVENDAPLQTEAILIVQLNPVLNTRGIKLLEPEVF